MLVPGLTYLGISVPPDFISLRILRFQRFFLFRERFFLDKVLTYNLYIKNVSIQALNSKKVYDLELELRFKI